MAELTIKISEEKYKGTVSQLQTKVSALQDNLDKLGEQKQEISKNYSGFTGDALIRLVEKNEAKVKKAIENTNKEIERIQNYLDTMTAADTAINSAIKDAETKADSVFA